MATPTTSAPTIHGLPRPLARALEGYADRLDVEAIKEAHDLAVKAHSGQVRASGEEYVNHTVEVATILAQLRLDTDTIVAGLIHDTIEDTEVSRRDVERRFGANVAQIVDGVTKLGRVQFRSATEQQVENYRKMLLSMASDARVILVKLADRLHNMRTLEHLPEHKRRRIALETREIYAPLAHRLGMAAIRWELEDLAFKFLEPEAYDALVKKIRQRRKGREREILEMQRPLEEALREAGIPAEVSGRPKHLWSIHRKIVKQGRPYEDIYDLMAMRVLTDTIQDCYAALGVIHSKWTPIPERFHDYVATPKSNMYRSLHTTVFGPGGRRYEIQIRTEEMHRTAEYGIAAHWRYKEEDGRPQREDEVDEALTWFRQVLEWQQDTKEPEEFMEFLRMDLFRGEIFVFTPEGDVKALPIGATPIDFAYSVHTEVGHHCAGAKVNGRIAPLSRELKNGDAVEILTNPKQRPNRDWLAFVKTSRARQSIRQWIRREEFESAFKLGKDLLDRELKKAKRTLPTADAELKEAASSLGYQSFDQVLAALGRGDLGPTAVIKQFHPDHDPAEVARREPSALSKLAARLRISGRGVRIQGMDNLMVRYSRCCQPVPGDPVIGYVTRGRGVSIHRNDCPNVLALSRDPERRIEIEWAAEKGDRFFVKLFMRGTDRRGLLSDVAKAITDTGTDISHADMRSTEGGMHGEFVVEVRDLAHLEKVRRAIGRVTGVGDVDRREHFDQEHLGGVSPPRRRRRDVTTAFVTGITGMVGSHLADHLVERTDWEIVGLARWRSPLDNLQHHLDRINRGDRIRLVYGDLRDYVSIQQAVDAAAPDFVFHLAAQSYPQTSFTAPLDTLETNIQGTAHVLEALRQSAHAGAVTHVCASSEVFGRVPKELVPIGEETTFHPASPYAISKVGTDLLGRYYAEAYDMTVMTTRMFTHTGPRRGDVFAESTFAKQIALIEAELIPPVVKVGNLDSLRTFADVRDAVRAYHMLVTVNPVPGEYYNIGGTYSCTVGEMLDALISFSARDDIEVEVDPERLRPIDADLQVPDTSKFREHTGWEPEIPFETTMRDLLDYWRGRIARGERFLTR